jgi:PAT family beta-lactamase induction signal transducer AmpG
MAFFAFIGEGLSIPINADLFTKTIGWSAEHYGHMHGIWGTIGKLLGAIGGGLLFDRFGAKRIIALGCCITAMNFLFFSLTAPWWTNASYPRGLYLLLLECGLAMTSVSLFSLYMSISWTNAAATQFTLYMTVLNLGNAFGATLTGLGITQPRDAFFLCAAVSALPLLILPLIDPASVLRLKQSRTGVCPKCEYPIGSSPICTECGAALPSPAR